MGLLFLASVGIPVLVTLVFSVLEGAYRNDKLVWEILQKTALDLCTVSFGIVGGMFLNEKIQARIGAGAPIYGVAIVILNFGLASLIILIQRRFGDNVGLDKVAYWSLAVGAFAVAIPSVMIIWFGGQ